MHRLILPLVLVGLMFASTSTVEAQLFNRCQPRCCAPAVNTCCPTQRVRVRRVRLVRVRACCPQPAATCCNPAPAPCCNPAPTPCCGSAVAAPVMAAPVVAAPVMAAPVANCGCAPAPQVTCCRPAPRCCPAPRCRPAPRCCPQPVCCTPRRARRGLFRCCR